MIPDQFNKEIFDFIKANETTDPFELSLRSKNFPNNIRKLISNQVLSLQKLRKKAPEWLEYDQIILPGPVSIEQASSSTTAMYKSGLLHGGTLMDLTGGLGVDTFFFAKKVEKVVYVEKDKGIAEIAAYNFVMMGLDNVEVHCRAAEDILKEWKTPLDFIYIDPSRRTGSRKIFRLEESEPNLLEVQEDLLSRSGMVMIKASPFIDLDYAVKQIKNIKEVHIVAVDNECKEVLLISGPLSRAGDPTLITINQAGNICQKYVSSVAKERISEYAQAVSGPYIYDPNTAIRKAGLFSSICHDFGLKKPAKNSHIYFGDSLIDHFPGRIFKLTDLVPYNKFMKRRWLKKANIAVRNFPITVTEIRKKTKISEGGDTFVFGTTDENKNVYFIVCQKVM